MVPITAIQRGHHRGCRTIRRNATGSATAIAAYVVALGLVSLVATFTLRSLHPEVAAASTTEPTTTERPASAPTFSTLDTST